MRCHKARQRLIDSRGIIPDGSGDGELRKHLQQCSRCAAFARAESTLQRDIGLVAKENDSDNLSPSALRATVERRAANTNKNIKEQSIMNFLSTNFQRRPKLGISLGVVTLLLAFVTLVPFSFQNTVGYEVAIAGVNKDLAMDNEKITILLDALGMDNASINVGDCEVTCLVKISELESEYDAQIVVAAFNEFGDCKIEDLKLINENENASLFTFAKNKIFIERIGTGDSDVIHEIVITSLKQLNEEHDGKFNIWISHDSLGEGENTAIFYSDDDPPTIEVLHDFHGQWQDDGKNAFNIQADGHKTISIVDHEDGGTAFSIEDKDGNVHKIDLDDPQSVQQLQELGLNIEFLAGENGTLRKVFISEQQQGSWVTGHDDDNLTDHALKESAADGDSPAVPEGFSLSQNHPNPFNPTTNISYSVNESQHVQLDIININGQRVRTLVDEVVAAGPHTVMWDATDDNGSRVSSGIYIYRISTDSFSKAKKMTLLK